MSRPAAPIVCDGPGCQNMKQESNHWWQVGFAIRSVHPIPFEIVIRSGSDWGDGSRDLTLFDACGHECALKIVSEQMGKVSQ